MFLELFEIDLLDNFFLVPQHVFCRTNVILQEVEEQILLRVVFEEKIFVFYVVDLSSDLHEVLGILLYLNFLQFLFGEFRREKSDKVFFRRVRFLLSQAAP